MSLFNFGRNSRSNGPPRRGERPPSGPTMFPFSHPSFGGVPTPSRGHRSHSALRRGGHSAQPELRARLMELMEELEEIGDACINAALSPEESQHQEQLMGTARAIIHGLISGTDSMTEEDIQRAYDMVDAVRQWMSHHSSGAAPHARRRSNSIVDGPSGPPHRGHHRNFSHPHAPSMHHPGFSGRPGYRGQLPMSGGLPPPRSGGHRGPGRSSDPSRSGSPPFGPMLGSGMPLGPDRPVGPPPSRMGRFGDFLGLGRPSGPGGSSGRRGPFGHGM